MTPDPQALTAAESRIIRALRAIGRWAGPNLSAAIEAALEEPAQTGWQDISTAPKEGGHVLLFASQKGEGSDVHCNGTFVTSGYWDGVDEAWCATGSNWTGPFLEPTHWMPLPPPPVGSGRKLADANSKSPIQAREE